MVSSPIYKVVFYLNIVIVKIFIQECRMGHLWGGSLKEHCIVLL